MPWKAGLRGDRGPHLFVAHDQAEFLDGMVEHGALHDLLERPHMQAVAQRLLGLGPLAGLALDAVELEVELVAHLVGGDRRAADPAIERDVRAADMGDFAAAVRRCAACRRCPTDRS